MISHIVMWKIAARGGRSKEENVELIKQELKKLPAKIPHVRHYEIGVNSVVSDRAFDLVLISRFDSWEDLDHYRKHPEHVKFAELIGALREQSAVVDFES